MATMQSDWLDDSLHYTLSCVNIGLPSLSALLLFPLRVLVISLLQLPSVCYLYISLELLPRLQLSFSPF